MVGSTIISAGREAGAQSRGTQGRTHVRGCGLPVLNQRRIRTGLGSSSPTPPAWRRGRRTSFARPSRRPHRYADRRQRERHLAVYAAHSRLGEQRACMPCVLDCRASNLPRICLTTKPRSRSNRTSRMRYIRGNISFLPSESSRLGCHAAGRLRKPSIPQASWWSSRTHRIASSIRTPLRGEIPPAAMLADGIPRGVGASGA